MSLRNSEVKGKERLWYVGDPCYVIEGDKWDAFCELMWKGKQPDHAEEDYILQYKGEEIRIYSNGGDGSWTFDYIENLVGTNRSFWADSGCIAVMPAGAIDHEHSIEHIHTQGIVIKSRRAPVLSVEDDVWYLNGEADTSKCDCECEGCC